MALWRSPSELGGRVSEEAHGQKIGQPVVWVGLARDQEVVRRRTAPRKGGFPEWGRANPPPNLVGNKSEDFHDEQDSLPGRNFGNLYSFPLNSVNALSAAKVPLFVRWRLLCTRATGAQQEAIRVGPSSSTFDYGRNLAGRNGIASSAGVHERRFNSLVGTLPEERDWLRRRLAPQPPSLTRSAISCVTLPPGPQPQAVT